MLQCKTVSIQPIPTGMLSLFRQDDPAHRSSVHREQAGLLERMARIAVIPNLSQPIYAGILRARK